MNAEDVLTYATVYGSFPTNAFHEPFTDYTTYSFVSSSNRPETPVVNYPCVFALSFTVILLYNDRTQKDYNRNQTKYHTA